MPAAPVEQALAEEPEAKANAFTAEALQQTWDRYQKIRLDNGASETERLVLQRRMEKGDGHTVRIFMESALEKSILERMEVDLLRFFRTELRNTQIQLEKAVTEQSETQQLYTSREKFEYMASQNPKLRLLKEHLGLDFEY